MNAGIGVGVLMFFLLLTRKNKSTSDFLFLGWILVTIGQITFYSLSLFQSQLIGSFAIWFFGLPLMASPLLFLYIKSLTRASFRTSELAWHVSVYPIYCIGLYSLVGSDMSTILARDGVLIFENPNSIIAYYYAVPLGVSGMLYAFWSLLILRRHRRSIADFFSYQEEVDLQWLTYVVYSFFLLFVITFSLVVGFVRFQFVSLHIGFGLVGISLSLMLLAISFYAFRQTEIFSTKTPFPAKDGAPSYAKSGLDNDKIEVLKKEVENFMAKERSYLDENLNLGELAQKLNLSPSQLSQVLNQGFEQNFFDYVNGLRVEEVKRRIKSEDYAHLSILGIAFDCGFKSKSSFNRHFKKHTGKSPSDFKKE